MSWNTTIFAWYVIGLGSFVLAFYLFDRFYHRMSPLLYYVLSGGELILLGFVFSTIKDLGGWGWAIGFVALILLGLGVRYWNNLSKDVDYRVKHVFACPYCGSQDMDLDMRHREATCKRCKNTVRIPG